MSQNFYASEAGNRKMPKNDTMMLPSSLRIDEIIRAAKNFEVEEEGERLSDEGKPQVARW